MRLLTNWLREFVDIPVDGHRLAQDLTMAGLAVDAVDTAPNGEPFLEADITTNRPDCMNHYGTAREISALYDRELKPFRPKVEEAKRKAAEVAAVEIADPDLCPRYSARVILGVKVGPSPEWMVRRLEAVGLRSINNVADVTNYLLIEMGHPTHAFDLDCLAGRKIIVRRAKNGEKLTTLDAVERRFTTEHLVIADAEKPVAIGGVMGGLESGINDRTVNVLLESAWFEPRSIRHTARHFGMHTDASHRFERGADIEATVAAADRAAELIREVAGGVVLRGVLDVYPHKRRRTAIALRRPELERILGVEVPPGQAARVLRRLGFRVGPLERGRWKVAPPTFRLDVEREIDVIEEVARHYGYERFPSRLPTWTGTAHRAPHWAAERAVREAARALGYDETISFTPISEAKAKLFSACQPVAIANPLSVEGAVLRTSAVPGLLDAVEWNLNRGVEGVRLFEIGTLYFRSEGAADGWPFEEPPVLGLAATGSLAPLSPHEAARHADFYHLKGEVEALLDLFVHGHLHYSQLPAGEAPYYRPGHSAAAHMDDEEVARFGELSTEITRDLKQPVLVAEIFLDRLYRRGLRRPSYQPAPRFPAVERDFSLLLPEGTLYERVEAAVRDLELPDLVEILPVELFRGGPVPEGQYSLLLRARFQSPERTLSDTEVNQSAQKIVAALEKAVGAVLRA